MPSQIEALLSQWKDKKSQNTLVNPYTQVDPNDYGIFQKRAYQHDLQEAQYAAELQLMMYQNEYNSAQSQAAREREAGINPDLAGVSGEAAAGMTGNANPANIDAEHPTEKILGLVPTVMSVFNGLASGILGASHQIEDLRAKKIGNQQKVLGMVPAIGDTAMSIAHSNSWEGTQLDQIDALTKRFPRKYRGTLREFASKYITTPDAYRSSYESRTAHLKSKGEYAKTAVDPRTAEDSADYEIMEALRPLQEAEFEVAKIVLGTEKSKAEKMSAYWMNRDLGASAETENAQDKANKGQADIMEVIRGGALKTVKKLETAMDEGKWWATTALSALYASMSGLVNMPAISGSQSTQIGQDRYGNPVNTSSRSWNFGF